MEKELSQEEVWDKIAHLWNKHKIKPFGDNDKGNIIEKIIEKKDKKILDLGCGSGRNFEALKRAGFKGDLYGIDFSEEQLKYAKINAEKLGIKLITNKSKTDNLNFEDNFFDKILFIATLHCIETQKERIKSINESYRVLKNGGKMLITVWNKNSKRWKNKPKEKFVSWKIDEKEKVMRYYYLYNYEELKELVEKAGFKIVWKNFIENARNIILILEK